MPRNLSQTARDAANAVESGEVFLWLVRFYNPDIQDIRVVNNNEPVTSNGEMFNAYAFNIVMANQDAQQPKLKITLDNVDQSLIDEIRSLDTPMRADLQLVLFSQPDVVEIEYRNLVLRTVSYNAQSISGTLAVNEIFSARFPAHQVDSSQYSGVF